MKTLLIGNGYWGSIVRSKLETQTNLLYIANSKDNLDDVLSKFDVDYVFVCTPTKTHYEIVKKCLEYRKNVFCEKPFTGNFDKAKERTNDFKGINHLSEKYFSDVGNILTFESYFSDLLVKYHKGTFSKTTKNFNKEIDILH